MSDYNDLCAVCGFTYGSHRCGPTEFKDQCPQTEGRMDWNNEHPTFWKPAEPIRTCQTCQLPIVGDDGFETHGVWKHYTDWRCTEVLRAEVKRSKKATRQVCQRIEGGLDTIKHKWHADGAVWIKLDTAIKLVREIKE